VISYEKSKLWTIKENPFSLGVSYEENPSNPLPALIFPNVGRSKPHLLGLLRLVGHSKITCRADAEGSQTRME